MHFLGKILNFKKLVEGNFRLFTGVSGVLGEAVVSGGLTRRRVTGATTYPRSMAKDHGL